MRRNGDFEEFSVDSSEIVIGEHVSFIAEQKKKQKTLLLHRVVPNVQYYIYGFCEITSS